MKSTSITEMAPKRHYDNIIRNATKTKPCNSLQNLVLCERVLHARFEFSVKHERYFKLNWIIIWISWIQQLKETKVLIRESGYFHHFYAACCVGIFRSFHRSSIALIHCFGFYRSMYYLAGVSKISKWVIIGCAAYIFIISVYFCVLMKVSITVAVVFIRYTCINTQK